MFSLKYRENEDVSKDEEALYLNVSLEFKFFELSVQKAVHAYIWVDYFAHKAIVNVHEFI